MQFDWFVSALEVFTLLLLPLSLFARRAHPGITALLTVVTVLEILRTNGKLLLGKEAVSGRAESHLLSEQPSC